MQIWPAIDLRGGKCVRLEQGDYSRETVYEDDPARVAAAFAQQGARHLHLVDLEGAKRGESVHLDAIRLAASAFHEQTGGGECELGGGIRDDASVERALELGIDRVVIGTAAVRDPDWFAQACRRWPGRLVLGIDARDGMVATHGWLETSQTPATELALRFGSLPLAAIVYTDIATDGMLAGPNLVAMQEMSEAVDVPVVASGGVTTIDDVRQLGETRLAGCIIGRALYEGRINLPDALKAAAS